MGLEEDYELYELRLNLDFTLNSTLDNDILLMLP